MGDPYFKTNPVYQRARPGLQRWSIVCWLTAISGTRRLRDPNVKTPWQVKFQAGLWGWAFIGLFPLLVLWFGVWIVSLFVRVCLLGLATVFAAAYGITQLRRREARD
jgi:hypothetical protein